MAFAIYMQRQFGFDVSYVLNTILGYDSVELLASVSKVSCVYTYESN